MRDDEGGVVLHYFTRSMLRNAEAAGRTGIFSPFIFTCIALLLCMSCLDRMAGGRDEQGEVHSIRTSE